MALPNCKGCGARLTSLKEINGYNGFCTDCHKKNVTTAGWTGAGIFALIMLIIYWIFS